VGRRFNDHHDLLFWSVSGGRPLVVFLGTDVDFIIRLALTVHPCLARVFFTLSRKNDF
jgi:hypothetical protein